MNLKIALVDMNNGLENQAMKAFKEIIDDFVIKVKLVNPKLSVIIKTYSPRDRNDIVEKSDLYLSTGGPGSPWDGEGAEWEKNYFLLLDNIAKNPNQYLLAVCHSFQLAMRWGGNGTVQLRPNGKKFGIMPVYVTEQGQHSNLLSGFEDRLFAFEHRNWEVVDVADKKNILAVESRDSFSKGKGVLAFDFQHGIQGVQFHPEADPEGIKDWICRKDKKEELIETYGEELWEAMIKTLNREDRVIKTRSTIIPRWLEQNFNILAIKNGWQTIKYNNTYKV